MMNEHPIILINGPPQSGKDTIADFLRALDFAKHEKMALPLKQILPIIFPELEMSKFRWLQNADSVNVEVDGRFYTTRELQIMVSEDMLKPAFGKGIFGRALATRIQMDPNPGTRYVISDCGFNEEAARLVKFFGYDAIYLMYLHRENCNFDNDSREYIDANVSTNTVMTINNDGTVFELLSKVFACLDKWGFSYGTKS